MSRVHLLFSDVSTTSYRRDDSPANVSSPRNYLFRASTWCAVHRDRPCSCRSQRLARLYIVNDNEFPGVYDHATSSNPPLPFQSSRASCICMHVLRYATLYPHFDFAPRSGIGNVETGEPPLRYNVSSTYR